jgi:UDP-glucose 6-dehydrogenase
LLKDIKKDVLIIGQGIVGTNLANELVHLKPDVYDKYKGKDNRSLNDYHVAFICVDTPSTESSLCDISEVRNAIIENDAEIYVIKSTVLPGTIDALRVELNKRIIFSPEYYGATQHCNNFDFNFTILGGEKEDCLEVVQLLQCNYDGRHSFRITDARTAELAKYMENCWLATKVSFCNQFFDIANAANVNYEELRELFILDPRVNPSHTFVYREQPYWDSKCLNKDVPAIANTFNAPLLKSVIDFNEN